MIITYIFHSCYLIEFDQFSVLFDFYKDVPREEGKSWVRDYLLSKEQDLYVLCSHSHSDHFNPEILTWKKRKKNISYIFSYELLQSGKAGRSDAHYLRKGGVFNDHRLRVKAFGSTDAGCSFLLWFRDQLFFHAGDLNNWHWNEEVSKEEALSFENHFLCELELLSEKTDRVHIAMFPVDPRLGKDYMRGAEQFVSRIGTDYFLPMHFGGDYDKVNLFEKIASGYGCKYLPLSHRGQSYTL
ncbi:MAG: MBL fold metallo-hydrolase [Proteiniphilum sp.]|nr:MBL fold metallo-hydrolase [Proteiniphilum sp.]MDD3909423.1 MBL fold metallo-hydrolase [Proteiniphilum sp.]MDD4416824.1 MBL fold metallo-hydrolase [Proteiniphilum sp.]